MLIRLWSFLIQTVTKRTCSKFSWLDMKWTMTRVTSSQKTFIQMAVQALSTRKTKRLVEWIWSLVCLKEQCSLAATVIQSKSTWIMIVSNPQTNQHPSESWDLWVVNHQVQWENQSTTLASNKRLSKSSKIWELEVTLILKPKPVLKPEQLIREAQITNKMLVNLRKFWRGRENA